MKFNRRLLPPRQLSMLCTIIVFLCTGSISSSLPVVSARGQEQEETKNNNKNTIQNLYGPWALIAGASEGLGVAWADLLCNQYGINVVLKARREYELKQQQEKLLVGNNHHHCQVEIWVHDLSAPNLTQVIANELFNNNTQRDFGLLVYNAAHFAVGSFVSNSIETHMNTINVNVQGALTLTHAFANHWINRQQQQQQHTNETTSSSSNDNGGIILMSSMVGLTGSANLANYAATKAWTTTLANGLAVELEPHNIHVLACQAGWTQTPNLDRHTKKNGKKNKKKKRSSLDLAQRPQDVASECFRAMVKGKKMSVATGPANKIARFLVTKVLPMKMAVKLFSKEVMENLE